MLQAVLQTVHIKRFWEQHRADPTADVEQTEALLLASLQVFLLLQNSHCLLVPAYSVPKHVQYML